MCEHGTLKEIKLNIPRPTSGRTIVPVDACIAEEMQSINDKGIHTLGCCCGHGQDGQFPHSLIHEDSVEHSKELGYNPKPYYYADGESCGVWQIDLKGWI